jgi:hypothetical protein
MSQGKIQKERKAQEEIDSLYDIFPYFDSYLGDMETCLEMDQGEWEKYEDNPVPYAMDLVLGFASWEEHDIEWEERRELSHKLIVKHFGV